MFRLVKVVTWFRCFMGSSYSVKSVNNYDKTKNQERQGQQR